MGHMGHGPQAPRLEGPRAWHGVSYKYEEKKGLKNEVIKDKEKIKIRER